MFCEADVETTDESLVGNAPPAPGLAAALAGGPAVAAEFDTTDVSSVGNSGGALAAGVAELEATAGDGDSAF
jgi:hypothetical protein